MIKYVFFVFFVTLNICVKSQPYISSTVQINNPSPCTLCCNGSVSTAVNGFSCALGPLQVGIQSATSGTLITWGAGALYNLCNGTYTVYIDFLGGQTCGSYLVCYPMYLSATSLEEKVETNLQLVKVFPNPVINKLNIEFINENLKETSLTIINSLGQVVYTLNYPIQKQQIDLAFLSSGIYYLKIQDSSEQKTFRIIHE